MEREKLIEYISDKLIQQKKTIKSRCLIIGIEGQGCSGKSLFSEELKSGITDKGCKAFIVSIDDFCNKRAIRYSNEFPPPEQHYFRNFNYEYFENCILKQAKYSGKLIINENVLNVATDGFDKQLEMKVDEESILIIEGVFLYRNEFKKYYDYSILLQIQPNEQLRRASKRDLSKNGSIEVLMDKYTNRYIPAYYLYGKLNFPLDYVDLIIDNTNLQDPIVIKVRDRRR